MLFAYREHWNLYPHNKAKGLLKLALSFASNLHYIQLKLLEGMLKTFALLRQVACGTMTQLGEKRMKTVESSTKHEFKHFQRPLSIYL